MLNSPPEDSEAYNDDESIDAYELKRIMGDKDVRDGTIEDTTGLVDSEPPQKKAMMVINA